MQSIVSHLGEGAKLKYTTAYYYLPSGQRIKNRPINKRINVEDWGVLPQVNVELKSDELGIPLSVMVKIFEPFILYQLMNSKMIDQKELAEELYAYNKMELSISSARTLLNGIYKEDEIENWFKRCMEDKPKFLEDKLFSERWLYMGIHMYQWYEKWFSQFRNNSDK